MEIEIRKLEESDLEKRVELLNNKKISSTVNTDEVFTISRTQEWYNNRDLTKRTDVVFLIGKIILGMGGLVNISQRDKTAELYIYLSPDFHGKGLGKKCLKLLLDYGFKELFLNRIYLYTFESNFIANKMYIRVGFKLEGVLRQHSYHQGKLEDRNIYGILKEEWV